MPHNRLQIGVQNCCGQSFIFAKFWLYFGGYRNRNLWCTFAQRLCKRLFVAVISERKHKPNGAGACSRSNHFINSRIDILGTRSANDFTLCADTFIQFNAVFPIHQRSGVIPLQVIHMRARLAANFQQIAKPFGCYQGHTAASALDQRIGANCCSMGHPFDFIRWDIELGAHYVKTVQNSFSWVRRRGRRFVNVKHSGLVVRCIEIRKCPADIHTNCPTHTVFSKVQIQNFR